MSEAWCPLDRCINHWLINRYTESVVGVVYFITEFKSTEHIFCDIASGFKLDQTQICLIYHNSSNSESVFLKAYLLMLEDRQASMVLGKPISISHLGTRLVSKKSQSSHVRLGGSPSLHLL